MNLLARIGSIVDWMHDEVDKPEQIGLSLQFLVMFQYSLPYGPSSAVKLNGPIRLENHTVIY